MPRSRSSTCSWACLCLLLTLRAAAAAPDAAAGGVPKRPVSSAPPVSWASDAATYQNGYEYIHCPASRTLRPNSTQQLAAAIRELYAVAANSSRVVKVRATHTKFGSSASFPCAVQPQDSSLGPSPQPPLVVGVLMDQMTKVLAVNVTSYTMRVQAQMTMQHLYEAATAAGMSVVGGLLPAWAGLTLGGVMAASAHGSGYNTRSTVCDMVTSITWVDGRGVVHTSARDSPEGRGLCSGMGLLGVVTELQLQLQPTTHTRIATWLLKDDSRLLEDVNSMLAITTNVVVLWRPDLKKYTGYLLTEVPAGNSTADTGAKGTVLPIIPAAVASVMGPSFAAWQADLNNKHPASLLMDQFACAAALTSSIGQPWAADPKTLKPMYWGTGLTNNLQSVDCGQDCAWTSPGFNHTVQDIEMTLEKSQLGGWVADIRRILQKDLLDSGKRCLPPGFFVMRFGRTSSDYLATAHGMKEPVYIQEITLRSKSAAGTPAKYEWVQEAMEQLTLCKYKARPHWGKNFDRTFTHPSCRLSQRYTALPRMLTLQKQYDPLRMFEPELMTRVIKGTSSPASPECVMRRTCYCSSDAHCPRGHRCVASKAFPEYMVCKPPSFV